LVIRKVCVGTVVVVVDVVEVVGAVPVIVSVPFVDVIVVVVDDVVVVDLVGGRFFLDTGDAVEEKVDVDELRDTGLPVGVTVDATTRETRRGRATARADGTSRWVATIVGSRGVERGTVDVTAKAMS
jgi:hypothetical protein